MKTRIESRVGSFVCQYVAEIADDKVEAAMKRTAALAFAASLSTKKAGGRIADFGALDALDIKDRHERSGKEGGDFTFSDLVITPWTPSTGDAVERATAAIKSGKVSAEKIAELKAMLATLE